MVITYLIPYWFCNYTYIQGKHTDGTENCVDTCLNLKY